MYVWLGLWPSLIIVEDFFAMIKVNDIWYTRRHLELYVTFKREEEKKTFRMLKTIENIFYFCIRINDNSESLRECSIKNETFNGTSLRQQYIRRARARNFNVAQFNSFLWHLSKFNIKIQFFQFNAIICAGCATKVFTIKFNLFLMHFLLIPTEISLSKESEIYFLVLY